MACASVGIPVRFHVINATSKARASAAIEKCDSGSMTVTMLRTVRLDKALLNPHSLGRIPWRNLEDVREKIEQSHDEADEGCDDGYFRKDGDERTQESAHTLVYMRALPQRLHWGSPRRRRRRGARQEQHVYIARKCTNVAAIRSNTQGEMVTCDTCGRSLQLMPNVPR